MSTAIGRWLRRLTDQDSAEDVALSQQVDAAGCHRAVSCGRGEMVTVVGRLRSVDLRPTDPMARLVAELYDGTDSVRLVWWGRRSIPGIETGRTLQATGRLAVEDGHKTLHNPDYQLQPVTV